MAKRFHFDDEDDDIQKYDHSQTSHIDELEKLKETPSYETQEYQTETFQTYDEDENDSMAKKKKKKFVWKWWHFVLIGIIVLFVAFMVYILALSNNDGPVYGNRCQGIVSISKDKMDTTISEIKKKYSEVESLSMEIACKQLKVDIVFKDGMSTKKAKSIAEETVKTLDKHVGMQKDDNKTYSHLFGYENNVAQFEVNLFLQSEDSKDFPIYGTKHVQNDEFSYTLASVRDQESKEKAESTLKKE